MPGLAVALTLEMYNDSLLSDPPGEEGGRDTDVVGFVSGMLLGNDIGVKEWFSQYVKIGQKVNTSTSYSFLVYYPYKYHFITLL